MIFFRIRRHSLREYRFIGEGKVGKEDCRFGQRTAGVHSQQVFLQRPFRPFAEQVLRDGRKRNEVQLQQRQDCGRPATRSPWSQDTTKTDIFLKKRYNLVALATLLNGIQIVPECVLSFSMLRIQNIFGNLPLLVNKIGRTLLYDFNLLNITKLRIIYDGTIHIQLFSLHRATADVVLRLLFFAGPNPGKGHFW